MNGFPASMWRVDGQAPAFVPVSADPSTTGVDLPVGSIVDYAGTRYLKYGTVSTNWLPISPPANRTLQTVTLSGAAATMTVSGLLCDSRNYRIEAKLAASIDASTVTASLTGVGAATSYNAANVESLVSLYTDFDTSPGSLGPIYGSTRGTLKLAAKTGAERQLTHDWNGVISGRYFRIWGGARWSTTTGEATALVLSISAGNFAAGSSLSVFDDGVAT